jgi:hypothetical protein
MYLTNSLHTIVTKGGRRETVKETIGNESLYEISNNNGVSIVKFAS